MNINIFQWRYSLFLILTTSLWLATSNAQADNLTVTCTAGMNTTAGSTGIVNLGTITPSNANNASIPVTLNYSCTNIGDTAGYVSVCLAVDGGDSAPGTLYPRYMKNAGSNSNPLAFTMTLPDNSIWGSRTYSTQPKEYNSGSLPISASSTISGNVRVTISLISGSNNTSATAGTYSNDFGNGNHTSLTYKSGPNENAADCSNGKQGSIRFPFKVQATVIPSCVVTATSDINLGSYSAGTTNIAGNNSNAIGVKCTNGAPYNIGLTPSNGNVEGTGVMSGTSGNPDKVLYQLRSNTGLGGAIWGNTATSTSVGNGVTGTGTGAVQTQPVYVTVPNVDFKPDNYSDRVTIKINY